MSGHEQVTLGIAYFPGGERVASCSNDKTVRIWDVEKGDQEGGELVGPIKAHQSYVNCVRWSVDGGQLFSASSDRTIRCWDLERAESIAGPPWRGHADGVTAVSLSPNGTKLASASLDKTVNGFWDAHSGYPIEQPLQHEEQLYTFTFSPSGEFVASGGNDQKVSIRRVLWWDEPQKKR
ncbi:hypothetical protein PAXINDRAFT_92979 [Paxillus involutus ATCC 200175]|uniref:WD40 repeat-like protein n=1 Tax=Paxillus involutus ATCC 200175 TaxID=664439 RepID=A0A0C9TC49_PAXIN|nr:hypothetical protein PAXINDRAFT_92979 [Paxillus involutus ATCC 200175]